MRSRMDRYRDSDTTVTPRTKRNSDRYEELYREKDYDVYDNIVDIYNTNEIDITKVKKILQSRDDYRKAKEFKQVIKSQPKSNDFYPTESTYEEKEYDINSILNKAKQSRTHEEMDNKYRRLRNTQYDILSNLDVGRKRKEPIREPLMDDTDVHQMTHEARELQSLLDTMTNISTTRTRPMEDPSDLFAELKSTGRTMAEGDLKVEQVEPKTEPKIDKSFYTSSFSFDDADFEDFEGPKKKGVFVKVLIGALILSLLIILALVVRMFFLK